MNAIPHRVERSATPQVSAFCDAPTDTTSQVPKDRPPAPARWSIP
jgi:hypothetical protein